MLSVIEKHAPTNIAVLTKYPARFMFPPLFSPNERYFIITFRWKKGSMKKKYTHAIMTYA